MVSWLKLLQSLCAAAWDNLSNTAINSSCSAAVGPLRKPAIKFGTMQRGIAWSLRREVCRAVFQIVYVQLNRIPLWRALAAIANERILHKFLPICVRVSCHFRLRSAVDHDVLSNQLAAPTFLEQAGPSGQLTSQTYPEQAGCSDLP